MFRHILVPVDLTDRHARALKIATGLATAGGTVTLLHVIELLHGVPREEEPEFYERLEETAREHLNRLAATVHGRSVTIRAELLFGRRGPDVVRYAQDAGADLIVLTSHPVDPAKPGETWGTLSYFIGIAARCPVLLVK